MFLSQTNSSNINEITEPLLDHKNETIYDERTEKLLNFLNFLLGISTLIFVCFIIYDLKLYFYDKIVSRKSLVVSIYFLVALIFVLLYKYCFYGLGIEYIVSGYVFGSLFSIAVISLFLMTCGFFIDVFCNGKCIASYDMEWMNKKIINNFLLIFTQLSKLILFSEDNLYFFLIKELFLMIKNCIMDWNHDASN